MEARKEEHPKSKTNNEIFLILIMVMQPNNSSMLFISVIDEDDVAFYLVYMETFFVYLTLFTTLSIHTILNTSCNNLLNISPTYLSP